MEALTQAAAFLLGVAIVMRTLISAIRTLVLPRSARDFITTLCFRSMRGLFYLRLHKSTSYEQRDGIMAMYAPLSLLLLPVAWLFLITWGYALIYWSFGIHSFYEDFSLSGSSLLTLGFAKRDSFVLMSIMFSEAAIGLILIALLISYLPTMYSAFSRRESAVTLLEVRAGSPPSALEMLVRAHRIRGLEYLDTLWEQWEVWFADLEESHTSLAPLVFFRSPKGSRSWITAAGTVLDAAAFRASTLDMPRDPQAELCIRAGFVALRSIASFFRIPYDPSPRPDDPISVTRQEFDMVYDALAEAGVPLRPNRDQCWRDFAGWRVNYDRVLLALAALTMAPYAQWISDRSLPRYIHRNSTYDEPHGS
jgi:hypothetical protein